MTVLHLTALTSTAWAQSEAAPTGAELAASLMLVGLLLAMSAFFSGSETALFSLQRGERTALEAEFPALARLLATPRQTIASLLIGNEAVNVTLSTVSAGILASVLPGKPWLNLLLLTPVLLVCGEVVPKVVALRNNRRVAPIVAVPLRLFSTVVAPVRFLLTRIANGVLVLTGGTTAPQQAALREAHLRALIDQGHLEGAIRPIEQEILHKVFEFGDLTVSRLMTPRPDVFSLSLLAPWEEYLDASRRQTFSRIPIWQGSPDNIIGILVMKKLLPIFRTFRSQPAHRPSPRQLQRLLYPPRFVPTSKRADEMLQELRTERFHMACVVDEHGSLAGVVTLDDLLAELVGELLDETDNTDNPEVQLVQEGLWMVRAGIDVDDFASRFSVELPDGDYTTLGGFLLALAGEVPAKGDEFPWNGLIFRVSGLDGQRLTEVSVERQP